MSLNIKMHSFFNIDDEKRPRGVCTYIIERGGAYAAMNYHERKKPSIVFVYNNNDIMYVRFLLIRREGTHNW